MHNILLVEDDEVIRQQVKKILEQWGYEVVLVEDFMEVLSIFVKEEPHLVLMDIGLPLFNLTARNSPTSKVAGCKGFGLVQGLAPCA